MSRWYSLVAWLALALAGPAAADPTGLGRTATAAEIDAWNIDIARDGAGLPAGHGNVAQGEVVFAAHCAACHAASATQTGAAAPPLVGGIGSLAGAHPLRTVGSYWPYATTVFDYIRRAMPFNAPGTLSDDQVYAVTAFLLARNGILGADAVLDAGSLASVRMPNRDGFHSFYEDPR